MKKKTRILEIIHNPNFNRVGFDTVKSSAGLNSFLTENPNIKRLK